MNDNKKIKQAVIFAGGLGTRLKPFTDDNPKPMYPINGTPFIEYLINQIKSFGIDDIIILLGYLPYKIIDYLGEGKKYGVHIRYSITPAEYDTAFRLKDIEDKLDDNFLMMYCDNICPIDFEKLVDNYFNNNALIELTAYSNDDDYTKNNLKIAEDGRVLVYDKKRETDGLKGVDIGYAIVSKSVFKYMPSQNENFEAIVYPKLVTEKRLFATLTKHRYYSIGSFSRIELTKEYLSDKKYIFLDRDGTVCKRPKKAEYIVKTEDFIWLPGAIEALKLLCDADYHIIFISNQAGIGRKVMTEEDFLSVQNKMLDDLSKHNIHIEATFHCPHSWDSTCECRKPKPGMLYEAQKKYNICLPKCLMIGDDERDIITANNANMRGILVDDNYTLLAAVKDILGGVIKEYKVNI